MFCLNKKISASQQEDSKERNPSPFQQISQAEKALSQIPSKQASEDGGRAQEPFWQIKKPSQVCHEQIRRLFDSTNLWGEVN